MIQVVEQMLEPVYNLMMWPWSMALAFAHSLYLFIYNAVIRLRQKKYPVVTDAMAFEAFPHYCLCIASNTFILPQSWVQDSMR